MLSWPPLWAVSDVARIDDLVDALFDYSVSNPDGFTNEQFMAHIDIDLSMFNKVANRLRATLAEDTITLICEPTDGGRWLYRLVGNLEDGSPWTQNRLRDAESRFTTIGSVVSTIVNATDGRTYDGKRARLMQRSIVRLREDLADLTSDN